jgi:hypothetical protein
LLLLLIGNDNARNPLVARGNKSMIRSRVVSSFLTVVALSFVYVGVATANPIITSAYRIVYGYACTPTAGCSSAQQLDTDATSGSFVAAVGETVTEVGASATYAAAQNSSISDFLIQATGSASAATAIPITNNAIALAYTDSVTSVNFTLNDGSYNYNFSGVLSGDTLYGNTFAYLYDYGSSFVQFVGGPGLFSYSGTLDEGNYLLILSTYSNPTGVGVLEYSGSYDATLTLTPAVAAVPDSGDTVVLLLLASALLGAFALQQRRQV